MVSYCFKKGCEFEVQYVCLCMFSETYCCELHLQEHFKLPNRVHGFDSILAGPEKWTKVGILEYLGKEKSRKEKLKKIILASLFQDSYNSRLTEIDSDIKEISSLIEKISQISEKDEGSILNQLTSQHVCDTEIDKAFFSNFSEPYSSVKLFCRLSQLRYKRSEMLNKTKNNPEIEEDFKRTCSLYLNYAQNSLLSQTYQEYIKAYQDLTSLYYYRNNSFILFNTETEREEEIKIQEELVKNPQIIIRLPYGELFFICEVYSPHFAFIIDRNYRAKEVPFGVPNEFHTAIYFDRNVYCFGIGTSCRRFDLDRNKWYDLALFNDDWNNNNRCSSVVFNGNILISSYKKYILSYSLDINSFSEIPYEFPIEKRKILFNTEERIYLINGWIYESDVGDEYVWKQISNSVIYCSPYQAYWSYNKGRIYISTLETYYFIRWYFKFDLGQKTLIEIAYYNDHFALEWLDDKIEVIKRQGQTFEFNYDYASNYTDKSWTLYNLGWNLYLIDQYHERNKCSQQSSGSYHLEGYALYRLERYSEAIECYSQSIEFEPNNKESYFNKGLALQGLRRNLEAIECFDKAIEFDADKICEYFFHKGLALQCLDKNLEAIEWYDKAINADEYPEANLRKGITLQCLNRNLEALEWYNKAIKQYPRYFQFYCYRAYLLNALGRAKKSKKDFNKAHDTIGDSDWGDEMFSDKRFQDFIDLLKMLSNLQECYVGFKKEIKRLKKINQKNLKMLKEVKEKMIIISDQHSKILKKAVECLDIRKNSSIKAIMQMKTEVIDHQESIIDIIAQLSLLESMQ